MIGMYRVQSNIRYVSKIAPSYRAKHRGYRVYIAHTLQHQPDYAAHLPGKTPPDNYLITVGI